EASVRALSFHAGAFAQGSVCDGAPLPAGRRLGVLYPRTMLRLSGGRRPWRLWWQRWQALNQLISKSKRVAFVMARPSLTWLFLAECLIVAALILRHGPRIRRTSLRQQPHRMIRKLGLRGTAKADPNQAEAWALSLIGEAAENPLRLAEAHVTRALTGPEGQALSPEAAAELQDLTRLGGALRPRQIEVAARRAVQRATPDAPRAQRAAYSRGQRAVRIVEHMRQLRLTRRTWVRLIPTRPGRTETAPDLTGALLRALSETPAQDDTARLAKLRRPLRATPNGMTGFEWVLAVALRLPASDPDTLRAPWRSAQIAQTLETRLASFQPRPDPEAQAVTLTGFAANKTGLAQNFWMSAAALRQAGIPLEVDPIDPLPAGAAPHAQPRHAPLHWRRHALSPQRRPSAPDHARPAPRLRHRLFVV
ncbi:MAG: hypothetical protein AAF245_13125, partial [Pseudomonadota bacterium]